jgi:hypothetical protein
MMWAVLIGIFGSALVAIAIRLLFPRVDTWLPVLVASLVPPLVVFAVGMFLVLRDIGAIAENAASPNNVIGGHADSVSTIIQISGIWPFVALPVSIVTLWTFKRLKART